MKLKPVKLLLKKKVERKKLELQEKETELRALTPKLKKSVASSELHMKAHIAMSDILKLNTYIKRWEL